MTAEYACTRKQFNKSLSEFGLIQVLRVEPHTCWSHLCVLCALRVCAGGSVLVAEDTIDLRRTRLPDMCWGLSPGREASVPVTFPTGWQLWVSAHTKHFLIVFLQCPRKSLR